MPDNLYRQLNQSVLIDVDGVLIAPMGEFIINAPAELSKAIITLERGVKSHGFDFEYSDLSFGFDRVKFNEVTDIYSPYSFIKAIYEFSGVDANVMFEFRARKSSDVPFETQYIGDLSFEEVEILDRKINLKSMRKNLDDLFRTRQKTKVSFGATESIDGEVITGLVADDVFLHSKIIRQETTSSITNEFRDESTVIFTRLPSCGNQRINLGDLNWKVDKNEVTFNSGGYAFFDEGFKILQTPASPYTNWIIPSYYVLNVEKDSYEAEFYLKMKGGYGSSTDPVNLKINILEIVDGNETRTEVYNVLTPINTPQDFDFDVTHRITKLSSEEFTTDVKIEFVTDEIPCDGNSGWSITLDNDENQFNLAINTRTQNSTAKAYKPFEATNHILEVINNRTDMVISSFINDEANDIYQTNGYSIRGFEDRLPETSFDDQFYKWLQPMFGLGYAVVYDVDKFKVLIERYSHFYQDVEIDYFDTINDGSWSITADKSVIFNEFEVGYSKFPSSTDENKQNTIDEFNTIHNDLSPIKTVEKKSTYKSDAIGSGYLLENSRREQFKEVPSDTVTNDDAMFLAKTVNNDLYTIEGDFALGINSVETDDVENTVKLLGTYFDIRVGDVINLNRVSGASPIEGNYTVSVVTLIGNNTLLNCVSVTATGTSTDEYEITLPENRLRAERNENVDVLNNVISPETSYNVGLNPKNMLLNQSPLFNSGFHPKPDTAEIKTQTVSLNGEMESQFSLGEGGYVLDPARQLIKQNQTLSLSQVNQNIKLFTGRLIKFTTTINYDRVLSIRDACLNVSTNGDNYGYIRVKDPFGVDYKGFIMNMEYNPLSEEVDFELREKFE